MIIAKITSSYSDLTISQKRIADVILKNATEVLAMTAEQLGNEAGTSAASVIRFCQKLKVVSFTQMKILLSQDIQDKGTNRNEQAYSEILSAESSTDLRNKLLANSIRAMEDTFQQIDGMSIKTINQSIYTAPVIFIFGMGSSWLVAENFFQKWIKTGKNILLNKDPHILLSAFATAPEGSMLLVISNSGETKEILEMTKIAQKYQIKVVAITKFGDNSLSKLADESLLSIKSYEPIERTAATSSLHAQFLIIDMLYLEYLATYKTVFATVKRTREAISNYENEI